MRRVVMAFVLAGLLVLVVAACGSSGSSTETPVSAPATTPAGTDTGASAGDGSSADGAAIFTSNCAGCHGVDGSGGSGPSLQTEDNLDKVVQKVTGGGENMPPFAGQLSTAEIQSVAEYVTNGFQ
jgi:cytochrome c551